MKFSKGYRLLLTLMCLFVVGVLFAQWNRATASLSPITINTVDYENENIIINNNGNARIFYATETEASKGMWDVIDADPGITTTIDFSFLSPSMENVIVVKGEENQAQSRVTLVERTKKLEISINYSNISQLDKSDTIAPLLNIMTSAGTASNPINFQDLEWKKGEQGKWKDIEELTKAQIEKLQIRGAMISLRIKAVNDVSNADYVAKGLKGRRASSEYKLKIAKKATAMVVGIDGSRFKADIKFGKEYRVTINNLRSQWTKVTDRSTTKIPLRTVFNMGSDAKLLNIAFPAAIIEIRDYATAKTPASKITKITLDAQRTIKGSIIEGYAPEDATIEDNNVYLAYNGISNMVLTIPSATAREPYEYTVVRPGDTFDFDRVIWTSITKNTPVKILSSRAVDGGIIYIRKSEIKSKAATNTTPAVAYALASTYVSQSINYPSIPAITSTTYTFTKGYTGDITFDVKLNKIGKKPYETAIKSIKLGTKELDFTTTVTPNIAGGVNEDTVYTMTVNLRKEMLGVLANCYSKAITITYVNGTVDKTSVKLTIQNPTLATALMATLKPGNAAGTTTVNISSIIGSKNKIVYTIDDAEIKNKITEDTVAGGIDYKIGDDITIAVSKYLTVYEVNATTNKIVKYKSILVTIDKIK